MVDPNVNEKVWDFLLSGGVFMAFIAMCSFVAIAVSIHRTLTLRWSAIIPDYLGAEIARCSEYFRQRKTSTLFRALKRSDSTIGKIGRIALSSEYGSREAATEAVEATAKEQMVKLENGMGVLEVVITIAPLLGLLGTVSGLVSVFATLGNQGDVADPSLIAAGIAVALNTTIAGLVVAVVTVIFHSSFTRRLERIAARLEVIAGGLVHEFYKEGGPKLYEDEPDPDGPDENSVKAIEASGLATEPGNQ